MIRRTRSEAARVRKLVERTPPQFVTCRAFNRHPFGEPAVELERRAGLRELALVVACPWCGTKRTDRWNVRLDADLRRLSIRDFLGRHYVYPEGYLLPPHSPAVRREDWLAAYLAVQLDGPLRTTGLTLVASNG